jgi:hypothetical protein
MSAKVSLLYHRADGFYDHAMWFRFFNAAVVHLILHGFYKAYLFFVSWRRIGLSKPQAHLKIKPFKLLLCYSLVS